MTELLASAPIVKEVQLNGDCKSVCAVCGLASSLRCSNCGQVVYCNREHQKEDWSKHKRVCHPFKVQQDDRLGRYLVASRDIRADEVVLKEAPIIRGPSQLTEPVCLICLQTLMPGTCSPCTDCGWPLCKKCVSTKTSEHHEMECRMTREKGEEGSNKVSITNFINPHPMYQSVLAMRCMMLRETDPERWNKFNSLESLCEQRKDTEQWKSDREAIARFILRFYKPKNWTEEEILRTVGIAQINGHEVPITLPANISVYAKASLVEHNCRANLSKSFTEKGEILLWARFPIKKGAHLSICYTDALWGTEGRRYHLKQTKFFDCTCERCSDLTELGTHFSSLKCSGFSSKDASSCQGMLLPRNQEEITKVWTCNKCAFEVSYPRINEILTRAGRDLESMRGSVENCERFLQLYSPLLSPNHFNICEMKGVLAQRIGGDNPQHLKSISQAQLLRKVTLYKEILQVYQRIAPVENRQLGAIRFDLHAAFAECARRNINRQDSLEESFLSVQECVRMLSHEPLILPEGKICEQAKANLTALKAVLLGR